MKPTLKLYDDARAAIAAGGFGADTQTRISLFLGAARQVNAAILGAVELQPQVTVAYPFVHGQYYREVEFATLLMRATRWSGNWALYAQGAQHTTPLWAQWWRIQLPAGPAFDPRAAFAALALGHALLARIRLAPVIPENVDEQSAFVAALRRMEQESGRMIQTQIRLLKDGDSPLPLAEREEIIETKQEAVDEAFRCFLEWLAGSSTPNRM
ncbi:hypothetical protein WG902_00695 [Ramlibacter sp. PS3R-8]|uniref:hypothetical protein n=1 Tax=Ramlibacter sp. PS3R-8 TaxID=3133437 RepID=UPI0030B44A2F